MSGFNGLTQRIQWELDPPMIGATVVPYSTQPGASLIPTTIIGNQTKIGEVIPGVDLAKPLAIVGVSLAATMLGRYFIRRKMYGKNNVTVKRFVGDELLTAGLALILTLGTAAIAKRRGL